MPEVLLTAEQRIQELEGSLRRALVVALDDRQVTSGDWTRHRAEADAASWGFGTEIRRLMQTHLGMSPFMTEFQFLQRYGAIAAEAYCEISKTSVTNRAPFVAGAHRRPR